MWGKAYRSYRNSERVQSIKTMSRGSSDSPSVVSRLGDSQEYLDNLIGLFDKEDFKRVYERITRKKEREIYGIRGCLFDNRKAS